eukprot:gb/GECG01013572.1/.p1 GENE.gb/GECG01013572.1/~~gb/GECG01013572.1/.p1  ORF type:complete len:1362 (+),score=145.42 gb/GECG01013572.1/:1-4086(+)
MAARMEDDAKKEHEGGSSSEGLEREQYIQDSLEALLDQSQLEGDLTRYIEYSDVIQAALDEQRVVISVADLLPTSRKRRRGEDSDNKHYRESINGWTSGDLLQPALIGRLRSEIVPKKDALGYPHPQPFLVLQDVRSRFDHVKVHCAIANVSTLGVDGFVLIPPTTMLAAQSSDSSSSADDTGYSTGVHNKEKDCPEGGLSWRLYDYPKAHVVEAQEALVLFPSSQVLRSVVDLPMAKAVSPSFPWRQGQTQARLDYCFVNLPIDCPATLWSQIMKNGRRGKSSASAKQNVQREEKNTSSELDQPINVYCLIHGIGKLEYDRNGNEFFAVGVHLLHRDGSMFYPPEQQDYDANGAKEDIKTDNVQQCTNCARRCTALSTRGLEETTHHRVRWSVDIVFPARRMCKVYHVLKSRNDYIITNLRVKKSPFDRTGHNLVFQAHGVADEHAGHTTVIDICSEVALQNTLRALKVENPYLNESEVVDYTGIITAVHPNAVQLDNHPQLTLWMASGSVGRGGATYTVTFPRLGIRCGAQVTLHNVQPIFFGEHMFAGFSPIRDRSSISLVALSPYSLAKSPPVPITSRASSSAVSQQSPALALWMGRLERILRSTVGVNEEWLRHMCEQSVQFLTLSNVMPESTYVMSPIEAMAAAYVLINDNRAVSKGCCNWNLLRVDNEGIKGLTGFPNFALVCEFSKYTREGREEFVLSDCSASIQVHFDNEWGQDIPDSKFAMLIHNPVIVVEEFTASSAKQAFDEVLHGKEEKLRHCFGMPRLIEDCLEMESTDRGTMAAYFTELCKTLLFKQLSVRGRSENLCVLGGSVSPDSCLDFGASGKSYDKRNIKSANGVIGVRECLLPHASDVYRILKSANVEDSVRHIVPGEPTREFSIEGLFLSKSVSVTNLGARNDEWSTNAIRIGQPPTPEQLLCGCSYDKIVVTIRLLDTQTADYIDIVNLPTSRGCMPPTFLPGERVTLRRLKREVQNGKIVLVSKGTLDVSLEAMAGTSGPQLKQNPEDVSYLMKLHSPGVTMGLDLTSKLIRVQIVSLSWFTMKWIDTITGSELYPASVSSTAPTTTLYGTTVKRTGAAAMDSGGITPTFVFTAGFFASDGTSEVRLTATGFQAFFLSGLAWGSLCEWAGVTAKYGKLDWNSAFSSERKSPAMVALDHEHSRRKIRTRLDAVLLLKSDINDNLMGISAKQAFSVLRRQQERSSGAPFAHEFNQAAEQREGALPVDRGSTYLSEYDQPFPSPWYDCWVRHDYKDVWKLASKSGILDDNIREVAWRLSLPSSVVSKIYEIQWNSVSFSQRPSETTSEVKDLSPPATLVPFSLGNQVIRTQKMAGLSMKVIAAKPVYSDGRLHEIRRRKN